MKKLLIFSTLLLSSILVLACDQASTTSLTTSATTTSVTTTTTETTTTTTSSLCKASYHDYDEETLDYQLVFYDEFDKESGTPSILKWKYQVGDGGWGNDELQYYTDGANASIINYNLVISARKEAMGSSEYTSARMNSVRSFQYGKIEVKAILPQGSGTWPAIWMMPQSSVYGSWPNSGEIDIMEHVGTDMNRIHFSIHTEKYYFKIGTQKTYVTTIQSVAEMYHVYAIEWLPDKIKFMVDDHVYFTYDPNVYASCPTSEEWPFDKPFYLILNIAIGGWGGTPYEGFEEETMTIDYVRVYQATNLF